MAECRISRQNCTRDPQGSSVFHLHTQCPADKQTNKQTINQSIKRLLTNTSCHVGRLFLQSSVTFLSSRNSSIIRGSSYDDNAIHYLKEYTQRLCHSGSKCLVATPTCCSQLSFQWNYSEVNLCLIVPRHL